MEDEEERVREIRANRTCAFTQLRTDTSGLRRLLSLRYCRHKFPTRYTENYACDSSSQSRSARENFSKPFLRCNLVCIWRSRWWSTWDPKNIYCAQFVNWLKRPRILFKEMKFILFEVKPATLNLEILRWYKLFVHASK